MKIRFLLPVFILLFIMSAYGINNEYEVKKSEGILLSNKTIPNVPDTIALKTNALSAFNVIKESLKLNLPELKIDQINPTAIPGIFEIISGRKVFYTDSSGRYAMFGNLVDLNIKQNLTMQKMEQLNMGDWNKLPLKIALKQVIGKGERKLAVFSDPDCAFCKRLEVETISKLTNITIYYFLFPLPMHSDAKTDAKKILCSENPDLTYLNFMKDSAPLPNKAECNNASILAEMIEVGKNIIHVEVTPTIVLNNGKIISGIIPVDELNRLIIEASPKLLTIESLVHSP